MNQKKCFVIMPISDVEGYPNGHFGRVYEHIIKPSCNLAGFIPVRADDIMTTNYIALDVIKNIIECEMAICDLSSRNPNVLYELGIRQAFNLPVTLLKDYATARVFDIQGFRDVEYDESLRIDNVEDTIEIISDTIKNTYANTHEINSLVSLLGIEPAKVTNKKEISIETELILGGIQSLEKRITEMERQNSYFTGSNISQVSSAIPVPDNIGEMITLPEIGTVKPGDKIFQHRFGIGEVKNIPKSTNSEGQTIEVEFERGIKRFVLKFAKLYKLK